MGYHWEGGSHNKCSYDVVWQLWMYRPMSCYRNVERQMLLYQSGIYQLNCRKCWPQPLKWHFLVQNRPVCNVAHYNIGRKPLPSNTTQACNTTLSPTQHEDPIISTMTIVTMNPVEREHKLKIHACRHFMNTLYSINKGNSACPSCTMPW